MSSEGRRATLRDVADAVGVSTALVSFAINDRPGVSAETKARILAEVERLGYRADPVARALRTGQSRLFGLVVRNLQNPYFLDVVGGLQQAAAEVHAGVVVADADYSAEREAAHVEALAGQRIDGLAIAPVGSGAVIRRWQSLRPGLHTVVINATAPGLDGVSRVSPDNVGAVTQAAEHLAELGHQRIGFLTAPAEVMADHDRLETALRVAPSLGVEIVPVEVQLNLAAVHDRVGALLDAPGAPTAVITNSDFTAIAVYNAARERGLAIGSDLSVVGHDDLPTSHLLDPPLTTLRVDGRALGRAVFARLAGAVDADTHFEPVELVVSGSTGPPAGG